MYIINITMQELSRKSQTTEICWAREREEREEEGEMEREREREVRDGAESGQSR